MDQQRRELDRARVQFLACRAHQYIVAAPGQTAVWCGTFNDLNPPLLGFNNVSGGAGGTAYGGSCGTPTGTNGNISIDPMFVDAAAGDYHLLAGSPNIDAGNNAAPVLPLVDIDLTARIVDGNDDGTFAIDIVADEFVALSSRN